jgi:putative SOS response-associated peptidase YedK
MIPIITREPEKPLNKFEQASWGFIPAWVKDSKAALKSINARSETLLAKPYFRKAFQSQRCLIPANGFYEWDKSSKPSTPIRYCLDNDRLFAFAGIFSPWHSADNSINILSCAIITTGSNALVSPVHDRMPVILSKNEYRSWLDHRADPEELMHLLQTRNVPGLKQYPVSTYVNNTRHDDIKCIERQPGH